MSPLLGLVRKDLRYHLGRLQGEQIHRIPARNGIRPERGTGWETSWVVRFHEWDSPLSFRMTIEETGKPLLRRELHQWLKTTTPEDRAAWSAKAREALIATPAWARARTVMLFAALGYEMDLMPLLAEPGKRFVFPALENDRIMPWRVEDAGGLRVSPGGIREPVPLLCEPADPAGIDLILVPGLGFGKDGTRLGRGKGHYDRFLPAATGAVFCGACFAGQVRDRLPPESHDMPMHALLTEGGWRDFR